MEGSWARKASERKASYRFSQSDLSGPKLTFAGTGSHYGTVRLLRGKREEGGGCCQWRGVDTLMLSRELEGLDGRKMRSEGFERFCLEWGRKCV